MSEGSAWMTLNKQNLHPHPERIQNGEKEAALERIRQRKSAIL